ncbi:MAG TPA: MFS transporter [Vicinamibacterales bacterium]
MNKRDNVSPIPHGDVGYGVDPSGNPLDRFGLSRPVWLLGWVSFFTDTAGESIYPLLPLFLTHVLGAGAMSIGVIEGVAEGANSLLKIVSGWFADRSGALKPLVLAGYGLSSLIRPLMSIVGSWPQVLLLRFGDRLGKGIRTSARDAMLASYAPPALRGRVYGFHQAMDHAGAVIGPLAATAYLYFHPAAYRSLFAWTLVPGIIVVLVILRLPSASSTARSAAAAAPGAATTSNRARLSPRFYRAMFVIALFSLGNSTDAFLLLRLNNVGVAAVWIPLVWSAIHIVKMSSSVIGGALSDRIGRRSMIGLGYFWYAGIYFAFGWFTSLRATVAVFLAYGIYFGLTEGVEKAWVADMAPTEARGIAFGIYNGAIGFGALAASLLFGAIWTEVSPRAAFMTGAGLALVASGLLAVLFGEEGG